MKPLSIFTFIISSMFLFSGETTYLSIEKLKYMNISKIQSKLKGTYLSVSTQMGWKSPRPLKNYALKIDGKNKLTLYYTTSNIETPFKLVNEYTYLITNNNGILEIKTEVINEKIDLLTPPALTWFTGILYLSANYKEIMFGNGIEIDGGPATKWLKKMKK